jgi:hypothetical protein
VATVGKQSPASAKSTETAGLAGVNGFVWNVPGTAVDDERRGHEYGGYQKSVIGYQEADTGCQQSAISGQEAEYQREAMWKQGLDEEVEGEEKKPQEEEEGTPGEAAAGKLDDGMKNADGDDTEPRLAAAFIERAGGNVARQVAAEGGEFVVHPEIELGAVAPERDGAKNKDGVTQASQKTKR